jgi:hypothetical protein
MHNYMRSFDIAFQVETVSLAFQFLKDETDSITSDNDGDIEHFEIEEPDKPAIFRFRPPPIVAITKSVLPTPFVLSVGSCLIFL